MRRVIFVLLALAMCTDRGLGEENRATCEQVIFDFIENGILTHNPTELQNICADPVLYLHEGTRSRENVIQGLKGMPRHVMNVHSVFFIRTDDDLKVFLGTLFELFPERKPTKGIRDDTGEIDLDEVWPAKWSLFRKQDDNLVKCVLILKLARKDVSRNTQLFALYLACERIDGVWKVICMDDG